MSKFSHKLSYRHLSQVYPMGFLGFFLLILECPFPCLFFLIVLDPLLKALEHQIKICFPLLFFP